jgi:trimethylguanosine synthase
VSAVWSQVGSGVVCTSTRPGASASSFTDSAGGIDYLTFGNAGNPAAFDQLTNPESEPPTSSAYPLSAMLPIHGRELFELTLNLTPNIAFFLPRNVDMKEVGLLAPLRGGTEDERELVEVEEEWIGDKLKAVTAYYGGLACV